MKKILVPTDFSDSAYFASDVAMSLAGKMDAEVHFYTRIALQSQWSEITEGGKINHPEESPEFGEMKQNFKELREKYASYDTRIITSYSHGNVVEVVANYIDKEEIDLVVMGSRGADGLREWLFGSNSQKVVRHAHCPVLVIKHPPESTDFNHILFASDFREEALKPFERLVDFAQAFNAHVHLLNIAAYPKFDVTEEDKARMDVFRKRCWALPCTVHGQGDINVELGITHFANDHNIDLIAIANYGEPFLTRMMKGSVSESLVNHLEIPVLALNTRELKTWHQLSDSLTDS